MKGTALIVLICWSIGTQSAKPLKKQVVTNRPPLISKFESSSSTVSTCGEHAFCRPKARRTVGLVVSVSDPEDDPLTYQYAVTGGEILGEGSLVSWKLGDQPYGAYSVTVKVTDSKGGEL
jgi:hypothetical protein